jgi:hypothetical protein
MGDGGSRRPIPVILPVVPSERFASEAIGTEGDNYNSRLADDRGSRIALLDRAVHCLTISERSWFSPGGGECLH